MAERTAESEGTLRLRVHDFLDDEPHGRGEQGFFIFLGVLIVLNVIAVSLSTVPAFESRFGPWLRGFELFSVGLYTVEYLARLWSVTVVPRYRHPLLGRLRWMLTPLPLIDVVAVLPSYLSLAAGPNLLFLRSARLLRLLRVVKLGRYSEGLDTLDDVIRARRGELVASFTIIAILATLVSGLMYVAEHDAQPQVFGTLPETMWWSVLMMSGEFPVTPATGVGRLLAVLMVLLGVGLFALPAGILASGFLEALERRRSAEAEALRSERRQAGQPTSGY